MRRKGEREEGLRWREREWVEKYDIHIVPVHVYQFIHESYNNYTYKCVCMAIVIVIMSDNLSTSITGKYNEAEVLYEDCYDVVRIIFGNPYRKD